LTGCGVVLEEAAGKGEVMGFLILLIVTVGATALGIVAATGMLVILFHVMRPTMPRSQMRLTFADAAALKKANAPARSA
jgi:hypothetical protein